MINFLSFRSQVSTLVKSIKLIVLFLGLITFAACANQNQQVEIAQDNRSNAEKNFTLPSYKVLEEEVYDAVIKTQVEQHILVSGEITEDNLKVLMIALYKKIKDRTGFEHRVNPNAIYIYAYIDQERFESQMGQWIAMLSKSASDKNYSMDINEGQLDNLDNTPEEKFGLSEDLRMEIWQEFVKTEDQAFSESLKVYPTPNPLSPEFSQELAKEALNNQAELSDELKEGYKVELLASYNISSDVLDEIVTEGLIKDWAFPKIDY